MKKAYVWLGGDRELRMNSVRPSVNNIVQDIWPVKYESRILSSSAFFSSGDMHLWGGEEEGDLRPPGPNTRPGMIRSGFAATCQTCDGDSEGKGGGFLNY